MPTIKFCQPYNLLSFVISNYRILLNFFAKKRKKNKGGLLKEQRWITQKSWGSVCDVYDEAMVNIVRTIPLDQFCLLTIYKVCSCKVTNITLKRLQPVYAGTYLVNVSQRQYIFSSSELKPKTRSGIPFTKLTTCLILLL
jgi:hypothetical protein